VRHIALLFLMTLLACGTQGAPEDGDVLQDGSTGKTSSGATQGRFVCQVLGTAQDGGLPHLGCEKDCCRRARAEGFERLPVSLGIYDREQGGTLLVEATPAVEAQIHALAASRNRPVTSRQPVDAILLTHAHIGHYAGLIHFGREVAGTRKIPCWVSTRMADFLRKNGPWSQLVALQQIELKLFEPGVTFEPLPGLRVTAIPVPHRDEFSDTMAFRFEGSARTLLFLPDIDRLDAPTADSLLRGIDVAFLDATFYDGREVPGRDLSEIPHPPMIQSTKLLADRVLAKPGSIQFIHLNHSNPVHFDEKLRRMILEQGFGLPARGQRFGF
jgi:pyrroloquinoline quinone biosynthesis protein B